MKKLLLLFALLSVILTNCKDENVGTNICGVSSWEELTWAKALVDGTGGCTLYESAKLYSCSCNGNTVLYLNNPASSLWTCNQAVFDCSGSRLSDTWDNTQWADFKANRTNEKLLWQKQ